MTRTNQLWRLAGRPDGLAGREHFSWHEEPVPALKDGEFLARNLYLSFDPTLRVWMNERDSYVSAIQIGEVMRGFSIAQIVESKHDGFAVGDIVTGGFGWQAYAVTDGRGISAVQKVPDGVPLTMPLSVLGVTGVTAYFGMTDVGNVKDGDVVVVSGAAGATGSVAGQVARLSGASRVIGIAGGPDKCAWLTETAGFDVAIDYKAENVGKRLAEETPKGIDVYFDNVGGPLLDTVLARIAIGARIVLCGAISGYNAAASEQSGLRNVSNLIVNRGRMQGFIILDYAKRFPEAAGQLAQWVGEGKLAYQEDIQDGLENAPETFQRIFTGKNRGKQLLKIADPE
ncbi:MAG: NADP-dependent oxidoreductase [Pseudomonadota bacterium]